MKRIDSPLSAFTIPAGQYGAGKISAGSTWALAAMASGLLSASASAQSAFEVDTKLDTVDANIGDGICADANGNCSLRAAVQEANATSGRVRIRLQPDGTYDLTLGGSDEDDAASGDLDVTGNIELRGNDASINAMLNDRVFDVADGARLDVNDANLTNGMVMDASGGGIRSRGQLNVARSQISDCRAIGVGASGGAIFNEGGRLVVEASILADCDSSRAGGAVEANGGATRILSCDLFGNTTGPMPGNGGALHLTGAGVVVVSQSDVRDNSAASEGGGLWNSGSGTMFASNSTFDGNEALGSMPDNGGGALFNDGGEMTVAQCRIVRNNAVVGSGSGGGIFNDGGMLYLLKSQVSRNDSARAGGGIEARAGETIVEDSSLLLNSTGPVPGNGGGLHLTGAGLVEVTRSKVSGNRAAAEGGGLWNSGVGMMFVTDTFLESNIARGNDADQGGGALFNDGGMMSVESCAMIGNRATGTSGSGGGILNNGGILDVDRTRIVAGESTRAGGGIEANAGTTNLRFVQLFRNRTGDSPGNGGGLHLTGAGHVDIANSLVTFNRAGDEGGGLWNSAVGTMVVTSTTVEDNIAPVKNDNFNDGGTFTVDGTPVPVGP